jgi:fructose-1,6-bisphosphatase/inositol monophosphatase family enzyme
MQDSRNTISLAKLLSVLIHLAEDAGDTIRDILHSKIDLETRHKSADMADPVTLADLKVQRTVEACLEELFPGVKLTGEEEPSHYMHLEPTIEPH